MESRVEKEVLVAGAVIKVDERKSKKGNPFAFITLSDATGQFEMTAFSEVLNGSREILQVGALVVASVTINREEGDLRLLVESLRPVDDVVANTEAGLRIFVEKPEACAGLRTRLEDVEQPKHKRGGEVSLVIMTPEREVEMRLPINMPSTRVLPVPLRRCRAFSTSKKFKLNHHYFACETRLNCLYHAHYSRGDSPLAGRLSCRT